MFLYHLGFFLLGCGLLLNCLFYLFGLWGVDFFCGIGDVVDRRVDKKKKKIEKITNEKKAKNEKRKKKEKKKQKQIKRNKKTIQTCPIIPSSAPQGAEEENHKIFEPPLCLTSFVLI